MPTPVLIKNLDYKYLEMFRASGRVLLSSLKRLREKEGVGCDKLEGYKTIQLTQSQSRTYMPDKYACLLPPNIEIKGGYIHFAVGSKGEFSTKLPDAYVFCTSVYRLKAFGSSSYRILDVHSFGQILFKSLKVYDSEVFGYSLAKVVYGGLKDPITDVEQVIQQGYSLKDLRLKDYFCKPSSFASEGEYRFVFFTETDTIQDKTYIENMSLVSLCDF